MDKVIVLCKMYFINNMKLNLLRKEFRKNDTSKSFSGTLIKLIIVICLSIGFIIYSIGIGSFLDKFNSIDLLLIISSLLASIIIFFISITTIQGVLFSKADNDLVMSFPVIDREIFISKISNILFMNFFISAVILIPMGLVYSFFSKEMSLMYLIILFISVLIIPLIPTVLATAISMLILGISSRTKYKNIIFIIINFILLFFIGTVGFKLSNFDGNVSLQLISSLRELVIEQVNKIYPIAMMYMKALTDINILEFIKLCLISILSFSGYIYLFSKQFKKISIKLTESKQAVNYEMTSLRANSKIKALVKKEFIGYIQTPIYVLNTVTGGVIILAAAIGSLFIDKSIIESIINSVDGIQSISDSKPVIIVGILMITFMGVGMSCTTHASISLEKNRFWILKSSPLPSSEIMKGKIILNLLITIPVVIVSNIILNYSFGLETKYLLIMILISVTFCVLSAVVGIMFNLLYPKMTWVTEVEVVKQSLPLVLSLLSTILLIGLSVGICLIMGLEKIMLSLIMIEIAMLVLVIIITKLMLNIGNRKISLL